MTARTATGVVPERVDVALVGVGEPLEDLDRRGLTGAVRPQEAETLAPENLQVETVDGDDVPVALDEARAANGVGRHGMILRHDARFYRGAGAPRIIPGRR